MSHFYGTLHGSRGEATRCGTKKSSMETNCASWEGAIKCYAYYDKTLNKDMVIVSMRKWRGRGEDLELYHGEIGKFNPKQ